MQIVLENVLKHEITISVGTHIHPFNVGKWLNANLR